jgi:uncharacterized membrane protein YbhN (UPF0104 family)
MSALLAAAFYLCMAAGFGLAEVGQAVARIGPGVFAGALALSLVNYALRMWRWRDFLGHMGHRITAVPLMQIYLAGFALTATPAKAGEMLRFVLLAPYRVPLRDAFAAFVGERAADLLAITLIAMVGVAAFPGWTWLVGVSLAVLGLLVVGVYARGVRSALCAPLVLMGRHGRRATDALESVVPRLRRCCTAGRAPGVIALSVAAWAAEAYALHWMVNALGYEQISWQQSLSVYAAAMIAGALSFLPGGIGGTEATMLALLALLGVNTADATALTVLIRVATLWFAVLIGVVCLGIVRVPAPVRGDAERDH